MAAAAVLLIAITTAFFQFETRSSMVEFAGEVNAVWAVRDESFRGVQRLAKGSARLRFKSGATVIVQAPASFTVKDDRLDIHDGSVVVTCPTEKSRALIVTAGDGQIADLGTQFGVNVTMAGAVRLQVFQGAVELRRGATATVVRAGQTQHFGKPTAIASQSWLTPAAFDLSQQAAAGGPGGRWAKYLIQLRADPSLAFAAHASPAELGVADLASETPRNRGKPPTLVADRFGRKAAISVTPQDATPAGMIRRSFDAITLCAWVKLDGSQAMPYWHRGLLMTDGWDRPGQIHWQCKNDGLRISFFGRGDELDTRFSAKPQGFVDGQWHLLTTTVERQPHTRVTHYLDGEPVFDRTIDAPTPPMRLDAFLIGGWRDGLSAEVQRPLYGAIDDLLVFARVLPADQVKRLYEMSRP